MVIFHHNYKYHNNLSFSNAYESINKNKIKNNTYTLNCTRNHQTMQHLICHLFVKLLYKHTVQYLTKCFSYPSMRGVFCSTRSRAILACTWAAWEERGRTMARTRAPHMSSSMARRKQWRQLTQLSQTERRINSFE